MTTTNINNLKLAISSPSLTITKLSDGTSVLLDIEGNQVLSFNQTGAYIIDCLYNDMDSIEDISSALSSEFDISPDEAKRDIQDFISELSKLM